MLGRPVLERLGAVVDFGTGKMRLLGGQWFDIERGRQQSMILRLAEGIRDVADFDEPQFDLRSKEDDHENAETLKDFLANMNAEERYEEMQSEVQFLEDTAEQFFEAEEYADVEESQLANDFMPEEVSESKQKNMTKVWAWMQGQLVETSKRSAQLTLEAREHAPPRKKLIWEVYAGKGLLGEQVERQSGVVMRFGLDTGWDFSRARHRKALIQLAQQVEPDDISMSPKCTLWSQMQNINVKSEADAAELEERRDLDHELRLKFCRKLYMLQVKRGDHAHIEHPKHSVAWSTPASKGVFDQCEYGVKGEIEGGTFDVKNLLRRSGTCPSWRRKPMQEGWELPRRVGTSTSWGWRFLWADLCGHPGRGDIRADRHPT